MLYVGAVDLVTGDEQHGQWLERAGVHDALMRPVPIVELLELPQACPALPGSSRTLKRLAQFWIAERASLRAWVAWVRV